MNRSADLRFLCFLMLFGLVLPLVSAHRVEAQTAVSGEKLWSSKRIVGPGGETCASCHDSDGGMPLDASILASKRSVLQNKVFYELVTKTGNRMIQLDGPEVQALTDYLVERNNLEQIWAEAPAAEQALLLAREYYSQGLLDRAIELLNSSLRLRLPVDLSAELHTLLGCMYHVLGQDEDALTQFGEALRLDPEASIDQEIFSPKTVELFERVRESTAEGL